MKILITGGTGLIGSALCNALVSEGHQLYVISRKKRKNVVGIEYLLMNDSFPDVDGVINMSGESIIGGLWSRSRKEKIYHSRVTFTEHLVNFLAGRPLKFFIQFSATGYYADIPDPQDESGRKGDLFLSNVCSAWERASSGIENCERHIVLRLGTVLHPSGGYLKQVLPLFRYYLGGIWGREGSHFSWVQLDDLVRIVLHAIHSEMQGTYNATSPHPITRRDLATQIASSLNRPAFINLPSWSIVLLFGELATLLLKDEQILPRRLTDEEKFTFSYPSIESVFDSIT